MLNYKLKNISPLSKEALKITNDFFDDLEKRYNKESIEDFRKSSNSFERGIASTNIVTMDFNPLEREQKDRVRTVSSVQK